MTISWRAKLTFLAGVTLTVTGLMLAFVGPGASGATAPLPVSSSTAHPTGPPSHTPTVPASPGKAPVTASPTSPTVQNSTGTSGDNGTVKIHNLSTAVTDRRNEPHVSCGFYLDAFGFDPSQPVTWKITAWAPTGDRATTVMQGQITLDANGNGHTDPITLPSGGHFKLFWNFTPENGFAKQKVFWVTPCASTTSSPPPSSPETPSSSPPTSSGAAAPPSPHGGLPITGWPLAMLLAGAAALMGTGTAAIVVARRRRNLQSSR